jgi:hypothetical protein
MITQTGTEPDEIQLTAHAEGLAGNRVASSRRLIDSTPSTHTVN